MLKKSFIAETKAVDGADRQMTVRISSIAKDRGHDILVPDGVELENYLKNPVVAAFHDYSQPAIATCKSVDVRADAIDAVIEWVPEGAHALADTLYGLYKAGTMSAWSVGFIPKESTPHEADWGHTITKWELLEFSAVLVPANQDAITLVRSKGFEVPIEQNEIELLQVKVQALEAEIASLKTQLPGAVLTPVVDVPQKSEETFGSLELLLAAIESREEQRKAALEELYTAVKV